MSNVVEFTGVTTLNIPADRILATARDASLKDVLVIGYRDDGSFYFASSLADGGDALWLLELTKRRLFEAAGE
jgi:hypothetical protein